MTPSQADVDEAYAIAMEQCVDCRDYHLTRPYLAASGIRMGGAGDRAVMGPLVREQAQRNLRVLIAGSADASLLGFVLDEIGELEPSITVVDRCRTPLTLCQHLAERRSIVVRTVQADLISGELNGPYDLVIAHAILQFVPPTSRVAFLGNLGGALAENGRLIIAYPMQASSLRSPGFIDKAMAGLKARNIQLPDPPDPLLEALKRMTQAPPRDFDGAKFDARATLTTVGLSVDRVIESKRRPRELAPGVSIPTPHRQFVIAKVRH